MAIDKEKTESFFQKFKSLVVDHFSVEKELYKTAKTKDGKDVKWQFADVTLVDGTVVTYDGDMPMVGVPIYVIPSDGTDNLPAPDGVLTFEDGTEVEVVGGIITSVEAAEPIAPVAPVTAPVGAMENLTPATEQAAKRLIESHVKETVFSKAEVTEMFASHKAEFETLKTELAAVLSANESLTIELGKVSAANELVKAETEKLTSFSKQLPELLAEFGATPQVTETEAEKKARLESFSTDKPVKLSDAQWKAKYIK